MKTILIVGSLALISQTACKSCFFSFMPEPSPAATATAGSADSQSGQIAIGQQHSDNAAGQQQLPANKAASYKPLQTIS